MEPTVETKFALLKQIFRLAQEQRGALLADHLQRFETLLADRQRLIEDLVDPPAQSRPENVILFPSRGGMGEEEDTIALEALLKGILEIDRENEVALQDKLRELSTGLRALARGRQAARGYRPPAADSPRLERAG